MANVVCTSVNVRALASFLEPLFPTFRFHASFLDVLKDGTFDGRRGTFHPFAAHFAAPLPPVTDAHKVSAMPFSVGSEFAGLNVPVLALKMLGLEPVMTEKFLSEKDPMCQRMLLWHFPRTQIMYSRVENRNDAPYVDVYITCFPCQPFSDAGMRRGAGDPRGRLVDESLTYIRAKRPRVVLLENVSGLYFRFRELFDSVLDALETEGYTILNRDYPLFNTKGHGIPQNRRRVIVGAVKTEFYQASAFDVPDELGDCIKLDALVMDQPRGVPGGLPPTGDPYRKKVMRAFKLARMRGLDPATDLVVVDTGASDAFSKFVVGVLPCVTATRGKCRRYFLSTMGKNMTVRIMERCQAFPEKFFQPRKCGVSKSVYGGMIGNSVSVNVFMRLWPKILLAAGLCRRLPEDYWATAVATLKTRGMVQNS